MGEVYRARDTQLDRDVALKVLPEAFASDHERLHRFEREAKALAALNHPNIAQVFGIVQTDGTSAPAIAGDPNRHEGAPAFSRDGRTIYGGAISTEADVWMVERPGR